MQKQCYCLFYSLRWSVIFQANYRYSHFRFEKFLPVLRVHRGVHGGWPSCNHLFEYFLLQQLLLFFPYISYLLLFQLLLFQPAHTYKSTARTAHRSVYLEPHWSCLKCTNVSTMLRDFVHNLQVQIFKLRKLQAGIVKVSFCLFFYFNLLSETSTVSLFADKASKNVTLNMIGIWLHSRL